MQRRSFFKSALITTGSLLVGSTAIYRYLTNHEPADTPLPPAIEKIHQGNKRNVLVVMSAGGCTGCEKTARQIDKEHLDNAYKMGLEL